MNGDRNSDFIPHVWSEKMLETMNKVYIYGEASEPYKQTRIEKIRQKLGTSLIQLGAHIGKIDVDY